MMTALQSRVFSPDALSQVNVTTVLSDAKENILHSVFYHTRYLYSSPHKFATFIPLQTMDEISGYHRTLKDKALYTLLQKPRHIYPLEKADIEELLEKSVEGDKPIPDVMWDRGGLFAGESTAMIAEKYLIFVQSRDKKGVLFFQHNEGTAQLAIGRVVDEKFTITSLQEPYLQYLEKEGISFEECVIFCDQYTDNIDIPLSPLARGVMTCHPNTDLRSVLQVTMCLPYLYSSQNLDFALLQRIIPSGKSITTDKEIVCSFISNQLQNDRERFFYSLLQQIRDSVPSLYNIEDWEWDGIFYAFYNKFLVLDNTIPVYYQKTFFQSLLEEAKNEAETVMTKLTEVTDNPKLSERAKIFLQPAFNESKDQIKEIIQHVEAQQKSQKDH